LVDSKIQTKEIDSSSFIKGINTQKHQINQKNHEYDNQKPHKKDIFNRNTTQQIRLKLFFRNFINYKNKVFIAFQQESMRKFPTSKNQPRKEKSLTKIKKYQNKA